MSRKKNVTLRDAISEALSSERTLQMSMELPVCANTSHRESSSWRATRLDEYMFLSAAAARSGRLVSTKPTMAKKRQKTVEREVGFSGRL